MNYEPTWTLTIIAIIATYLIIGLRRLARWEAGEEGRGQR